MTAYQWFFLFAASSVQCWLAVTTWEHYALQRRPTLAVCAILGGLLSFTTLAIIFILRGLAEQSS